MTVLNDRLLEGLRRIGDPLLDGATPPPPEQWRGKSWEQRYEIALGYLPNGKDRAPADKDPDFDVERIARGHQLFARYGGEISGALLLAALPQAYAAEKGAAVLASQGTLEQNVDRRMRGTAQFLLRVMMSDGSKDAARSMWGPEGRAYQSCVALRVYHQAIRKHPDAVEASTGAGGSAEVPLNHEDLFGTLLSFTVVVFEVLERFGLHWSKDDQEAYWYCWDLIGEHLGIGAPEVWQRLASNPARAQGFGPSGPPSGSYRPETVEEGRELLERIRGRQWPEVAEGEGREPLDRAWKQLGYGRRLARALLNELISAMPRLERRWPATVMRALAPERVRNVLGLGGGGLPLVGLEGLPRTSHVVGTFTRLQTPNPVGAAVLRGMSNEVVRRTMLRFLSSREDEFERPGLEDWAAELAESV